jgi:DNA-binding SARP family transcriptional activator
MKIRLLGAPYLAMDGVNVEITRQKGMAMLAYLAVVGIPQHRDKLAALFWPHSTQSQARASLRRDLSVLNKAIGAEWLRIDRERVGLARKKVDLDVTRFTAALASCRSHGHPLDESCADCIPPLSAAVDLYKDDFMAGFSLADCEEFDEWQFFQRENLRQGLISALMRLVDALSSQGADSTAIDHARRWALLEPYDESAHQQLIRLYGRTGQRAAALRQYQLCAQILQKEFGTAPLPETKALLAQIKARRNDPILSRIRSYRSPCNARQASGKSPRFVAPFSCPCHPICRAG